MKANEVLDVTTVTKENFSVTTTGVIAPVVAKASYIPTNNEVRLYLNSELANYVSLNPYTVTSKGLKNIDGEAVALSENVYFTPENDCELYDISIVNVWYMKNGATLYSKPASGPFDLKVRVVNSSNETKSVRLMIRAIGSDGESQRVLAEENISLASGSKVTKEFEALEFFEGETVDVVLEK